MFTRHQVHDGGAAERQSERAQRHGAVQEPPLVYEPEDLRAGHALHRPVRWKRENGEMIFNKETRFLFTVDVLENA